MTLSQTIFFLYPCLTHLKHTYTFRLKGFLNDNLALQSPVISGPCFVT